jgi:aspartyl-tRNA synthetase
LLSAQNFWIDSKLNEALGHLRIFVRKKLEVGEENKEEPMWVMRKPHPLPTVTVSAP